MRSAFDPYPISFATMKTNRLVRIPMQDAEVYYLSDLRLAFDRDAVLQQLSHRRSLATG